MEVSLFVERLARETFARLEVAEARHIPPIDPGYAHVELDPRLAEVLTKRGLGRFYTHQAEAVGLIRRGENVAVMTPAGSGKTLIYNVPVLEAILRDPEARALYVFPLKGLEQDQMRALGELMADLGIQGGCAVYDGDTSAYRRRKIRENPPNVVFTNPDMLHLALNAYHPKWEPLFRNLRYVVIDEMHAYKGVFGSHVAQVLRRLRRVARRWGSEPGFIASSATIANPGELARDLSGLDFKVVSRSGAPRGGVHFVLANPLDSPYAAAARVLIRCLEAGLRTIVFTKARKITELIYSWAVAREPGLRDLVSPYRAGFLPSERREIEGRLFGGELLGVVTTSALELGVDIGGLDACVLVGYPGSVSSTWQRAGRAGRRGQDSLVILIAIQDALDQYLLRHPEAFFGKSHEAAVIDPANEAILRAHLPCAASEVHLSAEDGVYDMDAVAPVIKGLEEEGKLRRGKRGDVWFSGIRLPHRSVGIRAIGEPFSVFVGRQRIGEMGGFRVFREAFPGAVYLHRGSQYLVTGLDLERRRVNAEPAELPYYTHALTREETEVLVEAARGVLSGAAIHAGKLRIRHQVVGYDRKGLYDRRRISRHPLEMPERVFETEGLWLRLDEPLSAEAEAAGFHLGGSLHALEHAAISCIPLFALCDKGDIGGISYELYPAFGTSAVFIYDGQEGGVGLARRAFGVARQWLETTISLIKECPCESGCPSCVQDPQCGSGNEPLDKAGAVYLAERLVSEG
ncbi:MAG: hypothetical protein Kow0025_17670 [Thermodesulfovibrionales bacterium]